MNKQISELTWEELLARREVVMSNLEEIEAEKKVLSDEFLHRLEEEKISGKVVGNWSISKATRYVFDTTIEEAKALGAVIQKEVLDSAMLKNLVQKGIQVPGAKKVEYPTVREVVKTQSA